MRHISQSQKYILNPQSDVPLPCYLDTFSERFEDLSEEEGDRSQKCMKEIERRDQSFLVKIWQITAGCFPKFIKENVS